MEKLRKGEERASGKEFEDLQKMKGSTIRGSNS